MSHSLRASSVRSILCRSPRILRQMCAAATHNTRLVQEEWGSESRYPVVRRCSSPCFGLSSSHASLVGSLRKSGGCGMNLTPRSLVTSLSRVAAPGVGPGTVILSIGLHSAVEPVSTRLRWSL